MNASFRRAPKGFTIVELMVVVTIITVLASLLVPAVFLAIRRARNAVI